MISRKFLIWWWNKKVANVTYRRWIADYKFIRSHGWKYWHLPRDKKKTFRRRIKSRKKYGAGFLKRRKKIKQRLALRDGPYCRTCLRYNMTSNFGPLEELTIDHIIPVSKGGTSHPDNLQLLCRLHHDIKDNKHETHFTQT